MKAPFQIDADFPGGNIEVESIEGNEVLLHQQLRDTGIDWFYWCFRLRGASGQNLRFKFTHSRALGVRGPAMSLDEGETWAWLGSEVVDGNSFSCTFPEGADSIRLSFAMPYQESHWRRFMAETGEHPLLETGTLCVTPKGREVEYATLGQGSKDPNYRVAITCRHHCCEMMVNYVLEGLIGWVLRDADAKWLRENVQFFIVPFADKDGVEDGDQGKGRMPRDHGRDYAGESIHVSTRAIREHVLAWGNDRSHLGLDLHCPHISGPHNEVIYVVGSALDHVAREQRRFSEILESVTDGPLPFFAKDYLPFGISWNTHQNSAGGKGFSRWFAELPSSILGMSIEVPYANAGGVEVNQASARRFGVDLAKGLDQYLRGND